MLRQVVNIFTAVPLKVKVTLSIIIRRLQNCPEMKKGEENKNQKAVRDTGWVLKTVNMATMREF